MHVLHFPESCLESEIQTWTASGCQTPSRQSLHSLCRMVVDWPKVFTPLKLDSLRSGFDFG